MEILVSISLLMREIHRLLVDSNNKGKLETCDVLFGVDLKKLSNNKL